MGLLSWLRGSKRAPETQVSLAPLKQAVAEHQFVNAQIRLAAARLKTESDRTCQLGVECFSNMLAQEKARAAKKGTKVVIPDNGAA